MLTFTPPPKGRIKYPPRFTMRNRIRFLEEVMTDTSFRACPGCHSPLKWRLHDFLIHMDEPTPSADPEEIVWVPELNAWLIPRYGYKDNAVCHMHGIVDWWLIVRKVDGLIVGWGREAAPPRKDSDDASEAGRLFETPKILTALDRGSLPFGGFMRKSDEQKSLNAASRKVVSTGVMRKLF